MSAYARAVGWMLFIAAAVVVSSSPAAAQDLQPEGFFFRRCNTTNTCPPGYYAEERSAMCKECQSYTFKDTSSGCCSACKPPNVVINNRTVCAACTAPTVPNKLYTACECPAGTQAVLDESTGAITGCDPCPDNTVNPATTTLPDACQACPGGTIAGFNQTMCLCPAGSYAATYSTYPDGTLNIQCQNCSAGTVAPTSNYEKMCLPCGAGATTNEDNTECVCPAGTYAYYRPKQTRASIAKGFWPPGFSFDKNHWEQWFSDWWWRNAAVCKTCQGETISPEPGANNTCTACPDGQYANSNHTSCEVKCPAGSEDVGSDPLNPDCHNCTDNTVNPVAGGTCSKNCSAEGKVADATATKCVCPAGTASFGGFLPCKKCDSGKVAPNPGSPFCSFCQPLGSHISSTDGINCDTCEKGYYNSGNATAPVCNTCAAGYFKVGGSRAAKLAAAADVKLFGGVWCVKCLGRNGETTPDNNTWTKCCVPPKVLNGTTCM